MKFTDINVGKIKPPAGRSDHWEGDDSLRGFGVRIRNGGTPIYGVRYSFAGRDRRLSFAAIDKVSLVDAKVWARKQLLLIAEHVDPAVAREQNEIKAASTLGSYVDGYLAHLADKKCARSYLAENTRSLKRYFSRLHNYAPGDIRRDMVAKELTSIREQHGPIARDRSRAHLGGLFGFLIAEGAVENSPVVGTIRIGDKPRERVLNNDEIKAIWNALEDDAYGSVVRLLFLTAARKTEIGSLRWSEINNDQIELSSARVKNRRSHTIPLSPMALAILSARQKRPGQDFVFGPNGLTGWSKPKLRLDAKIGIPAWVIHDIRRSAATIMNENNIAAPHIIEAIIGHVGGHRAGVAGIYNRARYSDQKREALNAYANYVGQIVGGGQ